MAPVLILQHLSGDGPAWLAHWLHRRGLPFEVFDAGAGQSFPANLAGYGALAILGGEMSANDALPSLRVAESLIREALRDGVPTVGHCLGGQLIARALGAAIVESPAPEIGWQPLSVADTTEAAAWFGAPGPRTVFQWHHEAFAVPDGAVHLAGSAHCANQAFAIGPLLAMQFHVEVDREKIVRWSHEQVGSWAQAARQSPGSVQDGEAMRAGIEMHLAAQQALADRIYTHWLAPR